ncbi:MAG: lysophospholipid acyltransferase family protein, partial [Gemmata sp.]
AVALAVRFIFAVVQMASPRVGYAVADGCAWLVFTFVRSRRRVALENLHASFPELAARPGAAERLVHAMYRHFCRAFVELVMAPRKLHVRNWRKHLVLAGGSHVLGSLLGDRAVLIVTAHLGNWELAGFHLGLCGFRTHAIARALDNPHLQRYALHFRQGTGQAILDKEADWERIVAVLKGGGKLATLADQDAGARGVFVDFFGRQASTHKAVALLAMQYNALMVVLGVPRVSRADYPQRADYDPDSPLAPMFYAVRCVDVIDPNEYAAEPNAVKLITARYTAALEALIRQHPEQYFWLHRRWKTRPKARGAKAA